MYRFDIVDVPLLTILNEEWNSGIQTIIGIYDSGCRYKIRLQERCKTNKFTPLDKKYWDRLDPQSETLRWFVNTFHQHSHNAECADTHSLRNAPNVGMVTGEEIETGWAKLNHLQYSIREMDAGARIDMITAHMLQINEEKIQKLGTSVCYF